MGYNVTAKPRLVLKQKIRSHLGHSPLLFTVYKEQNIRDGIMAAPYWLNIHLRAIWDTALYSVLYNKM